MTTIFQICLCGTQPGYKHLPECPYPLYHPRPTQAETIAWETKRNQIKIEISEPIEEEKAYA